MITIDKNYRIETDGNGCSLVYSANATRKNKDTKENESYTKTEQWHFLNVEQCLRRYLDLVVEPCKNVLEVLKAIKEAKLIIQSVGKIVSNRENN